MIAATVVYGFIAYFEWRYLRRRNRSKRAVRIVAGMLALLWLLVAAIASVRGRHVLGPELASLFEPLQRLLFMTR